MMHPHSYTRRTVGLLALALLMVLTLVLPAQGQASERPFGTSDGAPPDGEVIVAEDEEKPPVRIITEEEGFLPTDPEVQHILAGDRFTEAEAVAIANLQMTSSDAAANIEINHPDNVAGVALVVGGRGDVPKSEGLYLDVRAKNPDDPALRASVRAFEKAGQKGLAVAEEKFGRTQVQERADVALTKIAEAPKSRNELNQAEIALAKANPGKETKTDWRTGEVKLTGKPSGEVTPNWDCAYSGGYWLGGRPIRNDRTVNGTCGPAVPSCTMGMPMTDGTLRGAFTAGHCLTETNWSCCTSKGLFNSTNYDVMTYYIGNPNSRYSAGYPYWRRISCSWCSPNWDIGIVQRRYGNTTAEAAVWVYSGPHPNQQWGTGLRAITGWEDTYRPAGYDVCHGGHRETQYGNDTNHCANVQDPVTTMNGDNSSTVQHGTLVDYSDNYTLTRQYGPGGGSSGSSWYYGLTTFGTHANCPSETVSGTTCSPPNKAVYQRWGPVHDQMKQDLGSDADFVCYSSTGYWGTRCNPG